MQTFDFVTLDDIHNTFLGWQLLQLFLTVYFRN
jgi:hypothetical protein